MARIWQEPVPILAGPIFCTVDGRNLHGCNRTHATTTWHKLVIQSARLFNRTDIYVAMLRMIEAYKSQPRTLQVHGKPKGK
jgi:hypothetical protein